MIGSNAWEISKTIVSQINSELDSGKEVHELADQFSAVHNPICVDLHGVLIASESSTFSVNPLSIEFLSKLASLGTVIIITSSEQHNFLKDALVQSGLLNSDSILLTFNQYFKFICAQHLNDDDLKVRVREIHLEYLKIYPEIRKDLAVEATLAEQIEFVDKLFPPAMVRKSIASLFRKNHKIPLIDDNDEVEQSTGMLGIRVQSWPIGCGGCSLEQAYSIVEEYYRSS